MSSMEQGVKRKSSYENGNYKSIETGGITMSFGNMRYEKYEIWKYEYEKYETRKYENLGNMRNMSFGNMRTWEI